MMHRNRWLLALTIITLLALVAACGGGGTTQTGSQPPAAAPTTAPAAKQAAPAGGATSAPASGGQAAAGTCPDTAKGQTVTMWSPLTGPDGTFMTALADRFSKENTQGIKVQHLPQPEYMTKLSAAAAAKNLPEMTVIHLENIPEAALRNVLKPMSPEVQAIIGDIKGDFPEQIWNNGEYKGQRYSVPLDVHPLVLYYNKDMFKAAGLPEPGAQPMSKADFEKAVETLNKNGVAGISIGTAFQTSALFQMLIRQYGGAMATEDGTKATFNSDAGVKALQYLADMKKKYSPQPSGAGDPEVKVFQQGKAAMVIHGPWHISDMEKLGFVGYAPVPQIGDKYAVWAGSHNLALTTDNPQKAAAAGCWISWLSKNSVEWAKAGQVPIRNSVRNSPELKTVAAPISMVIQEASAVAVWPKVPGIVDALWGNGSEPALNAVLLGQKTDIKAALDEAAAKSNQIIEQNKQKYGG